MKSSDEELEGGEFILADLHRIRESIVEKFGGDLAALTADAQRRQTESGRVVIYRLKDWLATSAATEQQSLSPKSQS